MQQLPVRQQQSPVRQQALPEQQAAATQQLDLVSALDWVAAYRPVRVRMRARDRNNVFIDKLVEMVC